MGIEIHRVTGKGVLDYLEDAARLRIEVFREFPYLYEGDVESERGYLGDYGECPRSVFVVAIGDGKVVGVSTGLPLAEADDPSKRLSSRRGCRWRSGSIAGSRCWTGRGGARGSATGFSTNGRGTRGTWDWRKVASAQWFARRTIRSALPAIGRTTCFGASGDM